jgi:hypothetical protein
MTSFVTCFGSFTDSATVTLGVDTIACSIFH